MSTTRRTAVVVGVLFLVTGVTEVTAIGGLALYRPVLHDTGYVVGPGADTRVFLGALCEFVLALAVTGTGVVLYPVLRRRNEWAALGYVCGRLLEATVIVVGIISVLSVVTLRLNCASRELTFNCARRIGEPVSAATTRPLIFAVPDGVGALSRGGMPPKRPPRPPGGGPCAPRPGPGSCANA